MEPKVGILTDSLTCLTKELVGQYGIGIVPLSFYVGDNLYRDWVDVTPSQAYELFLKDPDAFKTSPASPGVFFEAYRELSEQGKDILCITLSSKLSTEYDIACVAKEQARSELPLTLVEVLDSQTVTASEGFIALAAARAAAGGYGLAEVVKVAEETRNKATFILLLETIRHVYRCGRIPKIAAQVGSKLNIKPILTCSSSSSGLVSFAGAVRNKEHGVSHILKMMRDKVGQSPVHVAVMHAYAQDEAERLKERISSEFNCAELWLTELSPLMGYTTGTGTLGFAYYRE